MTTSLKTGAGTLARAALVSVSAIALSAGALAQEASETERQEEGEQRQEIVTVYGTTNPIAVFDYPGQVSVLTREDIDLRTPSSVSDLLKDVPGMAFSGGPRRTGEVPSIRGFSGQNVLILLDGARQSFTSAHDGRFFADPALLGAAEVVRGPASALYGSGAVGGVLALESADAADLLEEGQIWGARVRAGYQSVNEETLASFTAFTNTGKFDGLASIGLRQSGDIELGDGSSLPSDDDITTGLVKGSYALSDAVKLEASWQRFDNSAFEPNNGQGTLGTGDGVLDRNVEKEITSDTYRLGLGFDPASDWVDSSLTVYQTVTSVDEFDATVPRNISREIETTGLSARNASRFDLGGIETVFTVGGDWYRDEQTGFDSETADATRSGVPDAESEFVGIFAQVEAVASRPLGLPGELIVIPGIRYDEFKSKSDAATGKNEDSAVSPRLAASYGPVEWLRVFASYAEGFRAPSVNELYLDGTHFEVPHPILFDPGAGSFVFVTNEFVPNADLKPEKTETVEFGAGLDFHDLVSNGDRMQAKVSYYESDVEDLINLSVDFSYSPTCFAPPFFPCSAGTTNSANVASAEIEGVEAELRYDSDRSYIRASYASIEGRDLSTGSDLGTLTPDRITVDMGLKAYEWDAIIGLRIQHASDFSRYESDGAGGRTLAETRDSYAVADLYASWSPDSLPGIRFDAGVDNIFDERYERVFESVYEPARNYKIAASWQFGG
ncbi:TonB-dependent hemoglobin/transferrin/lactoferrin family receptor [Henriciella litoralis]|uniref:TonB-dependent hemoglobin/transferrin/lactoferrin family receptor n=1 Tax=Henriciella litoralis TaxID=568102 RepID=UPI000A052493|nr:TonB-dependent hemoglobin/transferrin/lactoferrin family receptor [Henriciella litoralis]